MGKVDKSEVGLVSRSQTFSSIAQHCNIKWRQEAGGSLGYAGLRWVGFFLGTEPRFRIVCGLLLLCLLCTCVYVMDGIYGCMFSLTSGLSVAMWRRLDCL